MTIAWIYLDKRTAAVEALKDYSSMEYIIQTCPDDITDVREQMTVTASLAPTGMPTRQRDPHAGEARLAASIDEIDVLKERYRRALEYMEWFNPAWDALTEDERFVLSEFYCDDGRQMDAVGNICERFRIERSSAYNKKNRALARLALLLYGK